MSSATSSHSPDLSGDGTDVYQRFHRSPSAAAALTELSCSRESVLEQRAVQRWNEGLAIGAPQCLGRDVFGEQQLEPVEQFGRGRLLLEPRHFAQIEEYFEGFRKQRLLEARKMHVDDLRHRFAIGKPDVVEETAAQKRVGQLLLVVRRNYDERPVLRDDCSVRLVDVELHPVELAQQIVRKLDVRLVDFVDQDDRSLVALERLPQHAALDVVGDVADAAVTELRVAKSRHRVVFVETLLRLRCRFDVPLRKRPAERRGDRLREQRLAGARLAFDEQRPLERKRGIDGQFQVGRGNVTGRAFEAHGNVP
jgi:hypothetical protein